MDWLNGLLQMFCFFLLINESFSEAGSTMVDNLVTCFQLNVEKRRHFSPYFMIALHRRLETSEGVSDVGCLRYLYGKRRIG